MGDDPLILLRKMNRAILTAPQQVIDRLFPVDHPAIPDFPEELDDLFLIFLSEYLQGKGHPPTTLSALVPDEQRLADSEDGLLRARYFLKSISGSWQSLPPPDRNFSVRAFSALAAHQRLTYVFS